MILFPSFTYAFMKEMDFAPNPEGENTTIFSLKKLL